MEKIANIIGCVLVIALAIFMGWVFLHLIAWVSMDIWHRGFVYMQRDCGQ